MMGDRKHRIYELTGISMCAALICVSSYLIVPVPFTPVVLSMHTVAVNLTGLLLKPQNAVMTVVVYILLGLIGLPVFAGGTSGAEKLFGPTGGFYFGFLLSVFIISIVKSKLQWKRSSAVYMTSVLAGIPAQHVFAVIFMCFYNDFNIAGAFLTVSLPFLPGDIAKCVLSVIIAKAIENALPVGVMHSK